MTKKALATLGAAAAAAIMLALPASAMSWTWHDKHSKLRFPASSTCQTDRTLKLRGRYRWVPFDDRIVQTPAGDRTVHSERGRTTPRLRGRYNMADCLWQSRYKGRPAYKHVSELINARTGGKLISINYLTRSGLYHWGSKIRNIHGR